MPVSCKRTVIVKGVVDLVAESGAVDGEALLAGEDVDVRVVPVLYPVIRPGPGLQLARHIVLPHAIEQRHQGAAGDVSLGEQALARGTAATRAKILVKDASLKWALMLTNLTCDWATYTCRVS